MTEKQFAPNEVARLLDLPPEHPERVHAMEDPEFAALALALAEFAAPRIAPSDRPDLESARAELKRRLSSAPAIESPSGDGVPMTSGAGRGAERRSWLDSLRAALATPIGRGAIAFAALAIVASVAWRAVSRSPRPEAVRAVVDSGAFELREPKSEPDRVTLSWSPLERADDYRVVFLGLDLTEIARVDVGGATELVVRHDSLPAGLASGGRVSVGVEAFRQGVLEGTTEARPIQLP
ncbi:MAG TPA: hypothetical protein VMJ70_16130 [Candidatus Sulfotelmatobacter sp.]|nr:hypothetical protein [Candidatus Sulfotelmatobacter sp.]